MSSPFKRRRHGKFAAAVLVVLLMLSAGFSALAFNGDAVNNGAMSYIYRYYYYEPVAVPAAYTQQRVLDGDALGVGSFKDLSDIYYNLEDRIYLTDTGNNRIVVLDTQFRPVTEYREMAFEGEILTFNQPSCVSAADGFVYVADYGNGRIVVIDETTDAVVRVLNRPEISVLEEDYTYRPKKISVSYDGRVYVVAEGINQGLIQLGSDGRFMNFVGAPRVDVSILERIQRFFATDEEKKQLDKFVPTEYNSVYVDSRGFIYTTSQSTNVPSIARLNSQGTNVLKGEYEPDGDASYTDPDGNQMQSLMTDIVATENGGYIALDSRNGRIFVYDDQANLLHVTGFIGSVKGSFYAPSAIEQIGGSLVVTDRSKNNVTILAPTAFTRTVDEAVQTMNDGEYERSLTLWEDVLSQCSNYDYARIAIARIHIQLGNYEDAASLMKIGEKRYYSDIFEYRRDNWIRQNILWLLGAAAVLAAVIVTVRLLVKKRRTAAAGAPNPLVQELRYGTHVIFHPFDGFWDLKREKRGSVRAGGILFAAFLLCYAIQRQFTGYLFNSDPLGEKSVFLDVITVVVLFALWCIANWCFTTLMDGEGTLADIFVSSAYALVPYILAFPLMMFLSYFLSVNEADFYGVLSAIVIIWVALLLFFGMMVTHDYSLRKAVLSLVLTVVGILLVIFLGFLFINLIQQCWVFISRIYQELAFRLY